MAKISLKQKLVAMATLDLIFTSMTVTKDSKGEDVIVLQLEDPIERVRGSVEYDVNGVRKAIVMDEVEEVKLHSSNIPDNFFWDEDTDTGHFKGTELVLDISKTKQVWLTPKTFAAGGNELRTAARAKTLAGLFGVQTVAGTSGPSTGLPLEVVGSEEEANKG